MNDRDRSFSIGEEEGGGTSREDVSRGGGGDASIGGTSIGGTSEGVGGVE